MAVTPLLNNTGLLGSLIQGKKDMAVLQQQLTTGRKSESYGGYESGARLTVLSLRSELATLGGYQDVIRDVNLRLDVAQQTLSRFRDIAQQVKSGGQTNPFDPISGQQTAFQHHAALQFDEMVSLLNTDINGRHIFSGRNMEVAPLQAVQLILQGDGTHAGVKQVIDERRLADLGANGLGRLAISAPAADTVRLAQEADGLPFGFTLAGATSESAGVTITGPAGLPKQLDIAFGAQLPASGEKIRVNLNLPDGSQETLVLTATSASPPNPGEFAIGADAAATAANFQALLQTETATLAATALTAASAIKAADEFFAGTPSSPPLRVDGPPFDTATAQVAGTAADTVIWYQGDDAASPARQSALAKVDASLVVPYGMRADEAAMRNTLAKLGALATLTFDEADPNANARYQALNQRINRALDFPAGTQSFSDMMAELATVQKTMRSVSERHTLAAGMMQGMVAERETISAEEVSVKLLSLQTRMQASLQTTALLARLSLVNFL